MGQGYLVAGPGIYRAIRRNRSDTNDSCKHVVEPPRGRSFTWQIRVNSSILIQDVLVFETLRIIVEPMARSVPPARRYHSHAHLPRPHFHHVGQGIQHTSVECQWHRQQTYGTKHLPRCVHSRSGDIQESKLTAQSRSPNI